MSRLTKELSEVLHALDEYLGDTDPVIPDDWNNEDVRANDPVFWAHKRLAALLRRLQRVKA